jgi:hypothetical protein
MAPRNSASLMVFPLSAIALLAEPAGAEPLDLDDPAPRAIEAAFPGVVVPASYEVQGGNGIVTVSAESHELLRGHSLDAVPGSFTPLILTIALADGSGTSSQASGAWESPPLSESFTQGPLSTEAVAGMVQSSQLPALFCTSQQQLDEACLVEPIFCGAVCVLVPGRRYDADTGQIVMVGSEERIGCDGAVCFGPYLFFSALGPILSEVDAPPSVPALGLAAEIALGVALLAASALPRSRTRTSSPP